MYFFISIFALFLFLIVFLNIGIWENYKKDFLNRIHANGMVNYKHLPQIFVYALKKYFYSYKTIYININKKNRIVLEKNRSDKINRGSAVDYGEIKFVSANALILTENETIKTKVRLKGDRNIHYKDVKNSSYKFNLKGQNTFWGTKKFSIQKPRIRNYLHEWIFHELMAEGGLIKIKYDFLYFYLNGKNMGLYVLEEGFGKQLLERNKKRNGPIFSLVESFVWRDIYRAKLEVYNEKIWLKEENIDVTKEAVKNFKNFVKGEIEVAELFDLKKWAWFFAAADLSYSNHATLPKSGRFYFNPENKKFEPIPFDGHRLGPNYSKYLYSFDSRINFDRAQSKNTGRGRFLNRFFYSYDGTLNKQFYFEYVEAIKKISSKKFLDNFFKSRTDEINKITSAIYSDSFIFDYDHRRESGIGIYYYDKNDIYHRAKTMLDLINPKESKIFVEEDYNNLIVYNEFIHNLNLNLSEIICDEKKIPINLNLKYPDQTLNKKKYSVENFECNFLLFTNTVDGTKFYKKIDKIN